MGYLCIHRPKSERCAVLYTHTEPLYILKYFTRQQLEKYS